jgi:hypothetical protein
MLYCQQLSFCRANPFLWHLAQYFVEKHTIKGAESAAGIRKWEGGMGKAVGNRIGIFGLERMVTFVGLVLFI